MNSIFQKSNPAIEKVFHDTGPPKKVMCVPIDYAKRQHTALVCNGKGVLSTLSVDNYLWASPLRGNLPF